MDYLFIKFLLKKLNSKKTVNEVRSHISQTGVTIEKIVIDTLIARGWKKREAHIYFGELENEFKTKKKKVIQFLPAIILLIIICFFSKNHIPYFSGGDYHINDSIVNKFEKEIFPVKDSFDLAGQSKKEIEWEWYFTKFTTAFNNKDASQIAELTSRDFYSGECYINDYNVTVTTWTSYIFSKNGENQYLDLKKRFTNKQINHIKSHKNDEDYKILGGDDMCDPRFIYEYNREWKFVGFREGS